MDSVLFVTIYFVVGLLVLLASGIPIGITFILLGGMYIFLVRGTMGLESIGSIAYGTVTSETLITVPLFVLMGELLFAGGLGSDLFEVTSKWLGRLPGGLAVASIGSCALFASVCGSSIATTATIGRVAYPEMRKRGYDPGLAAGILTTGGGVGILIPPSIPFIIYAMIAEESVGKMFMAGVVPGLLFTILPASYIIIRAILHPEQAPRTKRISWKSRFESLYKLWALIILISCVLVALYMGIVTPSEAGAAGAIVGFLIVKLYRHTPFSLIWEAVLKTIRTSAFIAILITGAHVINHAIAWSGLPGLVMQFLVGTVPSWGFLPVISVAYFFMGMFMDTLGVMLLMMPILLPVVHVLGINPIWFGVILVLNNEIALLTPPVATNVFVIQGISGLSLEKLSKAILPFIAVDVLGLILCILFPVLSLWLPNTMG